jgi:type I restriction enzyme S subunit
VSELPRGWAWGPVGEIAETQLGKMLSAKARRGHGGRPYLRNKNVQWGRIDLDDLLQMDFSDTEFEKFCLREGDLLVCEGGEVGRAAIWRGGLECAYQKALHRIRPRGGVTPEYMLYLLMHYASTHAFERYVTGSTIAHLPQEDLRELPVPLPPLAEQRRIVAAIEEQLSRLDAAVDLVRRVSARVRALREAAVDSALAGNWPRVPLAEIAEVVGGVTKDSKRQQDPAFVEVPYLRVANVQRGYLDLDTVTTIRVPLPTAQALELRPGDVLFNEGGDRDKLGRGWVWSGEIPSCIHQNHVFRARLRDGFEPRFVSWWGNSFGREWFWRHGRQTTNLASMSLSTVKAFPVPAPPLDEQRAVVAEIERVLSSVDHLSQTVAASLPRAEGLRRSILARAFRGELVPQDPNDEPASALLKRIAAEREAAPKRGRKAQESASA